MEFIEVDCPVCSNGSYKVIYPDSLGKNPPLFGYKWVPGIRKSYRTVRCISCGHVYCSPRLKNMYNYYQDVVDHDYLKNENLRKETSRKVLKTLQRFAPSGKLLDIGCSTGVFISIANNYYDVEGLELSEWASKIAINRSLTIHKNTIKDMVESKRLFDIATMWGVIEHLEYPLEEMKNVNRILNMGGLVCIWTGNVDSLYSKIMGQRWWYVLGQHIQLFSRRSMDRLMQNTGFKKEYLGIYPYVISLKYLGISLSRYPIVGAIAKNLFRILGLENRTFTLKKSDEMFAIYTKIKDI